METFALKMEKNKLYYYMVPGGMSVLLVEKGPDPVPGSVPGGFVVPPGISVGSPGLFVGFPGFLVGFPGIPVGSPGISVGSPGISVGSP